MIRSKNNFSTFIIIAFLLFMGRPALAQKAEVEINYLWIDAVVNIDGKETRIVSDEVTKITCCMKSPKYNRVSKKASKWIKENIDGNYSGMSPLRSLLDVELASTIVNEPIAKSEEVDNIRIVSYAFNYN